MVLLPNRIYTEYLAIVLVFDWDGSRFAADNTNALIDLSDEGVRTVRLCQDMLGSNGGYEAWFGTLQHP